MTMEVLVVAIIKHDKMDLISYLLVRLVRGTALLTIKDDRHPLAIPSRFRHELRHENRAIALNLYHSRRRTLERAPHKVNRQ